MNNKKIIIYINPLNNYDTECSRMIFKLYKRFWFLKWAKVNCCFFIIIL